MIGLSYNGSTRGWGSCSRGSIPRSPNENKTSPNGGVLFLSGFKRIESGGGRETSSFPYSPPQAEKLRVLKESRMYMRDDVRFPAARQAQARPELVEGQK